VKMLYAITVSVALGAVAGDLACRYRKPSANQQQEIEILQAQVRALQSEYAKITDRLP